MEYDDLYYWLLDYFRDYWGESGDRARSMASTLARQYYTSDLSEEQIRGKADTYFVGQRELQQENREKVETFMGQYEAEQLTKESKQRQQVIEGLKAKESQRGAQFEAEEMRKIREGQLGAAFGAMPSPEQLSARYIQPLREEISPAGQRYVESRLPQIYQDLGFAQQRADLQRNIRENVLRTGVPEQRAGEKSFAQQLAESDPWAQFLKRKSFLEEWKSRTPRERGEFTSQFRPRTRVLR